MVGQNFEYHAVEMKEVFHPPCQSHTKSTMKILIPVTILQTSILSIVLCMAEGIRALGGTIPDPAVPMIQLPAKFRSHRANSDRRIPENGSVNIAKLKGPGSIRHIWFLAGDDTHLVIHADHASKPQIDVPLKAFFGIMHGLDPYVIDCAAFAVLPNPLPNMPGTPGYNLYLPIPFEESCRVTLRGPEGQRAVAMVDWHAYESVDALTPYRLHATHRMAKPAAQRGSYLELGDFEGEGFLAGIAIGYMQRNHSDMVFHTGGMTMLIDGETHPHVIRGHNVEDDFGFTWGFNERQTRWTGCPYQVNRGRLDQDGVFYRFFGPDPIYFESSLIFRTGARGDDMESMVYSYHIPESKSFDMQTPDEWQIAGLWPDGDQWETFLERDPLPDGPWSESMPAVEGKPVVAHAMSKRGWVDLQHVFYERHHGATPLTILNHSAYAQTTLTSDHDRTLNLRLSIDDWATVWINDEKVATVKHEEGFKTVRIPIRLRKGSNTLLLKTNNTDTPSNKRHWAFHIALDQ